MLFGIGVHQIGYLLRGKDYRLGRVKTTYIYDDTDKSLWKEALMSDELSTERPEFLRTKTLSSRSPFSSWCRTTSYYDGRVQIKEIFEWDREIPAIFQTVPGFDAECICHLKDTFIELHTGEVEDVHNYYFAGGDLLKKIRLDFKKQVMKLWQMARKIDPSFPHHTTADLANILDPFIDDQPRYFSAGIEYALISRSRLKSYPIQVDVRGGTNKGSSWSRSEIFYGESGRIEGLECLIRRRNRNFTLRLRNSPHGLYIKRIESDFKDGERHYPSFDVNSYKQYEAALIKRGLMEAQVEKPKKKDVTCNSKKLNTATGRKRHVWTADEERFIVEHPELTLGNLAERFSVSVKAVERKRAALRKKSDS